jgi:hypothetical protein
MRWLVLFALLAAPALAHDAWSDGSAVPPWVKSMCCGEADAHQLADGEAWQESDGWHFRAVDAVVPDTSVLPSQDEHVWAFWNLAYGRAAPIYCLFIPMGA